MIRIYFGNIYSKVDKTLASRSELTIIHELLSVKVPGHYFSKKYRRGMWDGQKKFFNLLTLQFYSGLIDVVENKLKEEGIIYEIVDIRQSVESNKHPLRLHNFELRDYQERIIKEALIATRGIISAPPNAGKTIIAAGLTRVLGHKTVFLTHRIGLMEQTKERFEQALETEIGVFGGGKRIFKDINIMSVHSVYKSLHDPEIKEILTNANVVIVDECHHASSKTFEKCLQTCKNAKWRYGLSATPQHRNAIENMLVLGLTGKVISSISNEELVKQGVSALPSLYMLSINEPKIPSHYTFDQAYEAGVLNNEQRNSLIVSSAERFLGEGKSVFILVWRIQHGQLLKESLRQRGLEVEFISGEDTAIKKPKRRIRVEGIDDKLVSRSTKLLKAFAKKELKCLISSSISDEGIDIPAVDVLIIGTGFKAPLKSIQRVGRALRKKITGPNVVTIVDFMDFHNKGYLLKHSMDRLRAYDVMELKMYEVSNNDWEQVRPLE